jgi:hypothetical protein
MNTMFKQSVYKFMLVDEFGETLRKFASKQEAKPYLTEGTRLIALPKPQDPYQYCMATLGESPF